MEYLDRGTVAVRTKDGVYLSWRLLGTENYDTVFDIYRDSKKIATISDSTNYTDTQAGESYTVVPLGKPASEGKAVTVWDEQYITIPLDRPEGGTSLDGVEYTYSPNDVEPADVDGDGEYELILKWEPSNSFDSGKDAHHNGNVYIDCYEMDGTKLWRIDMGININAGNHFTQIAAYDFDLDGKAELAFKTAPGTKDGKENYVSAASDNDEIKNTDNSADYRHSEGRENDTGGRVLSGPEYYTVFQGDTGEALDTVYYPHPRGTVTEWGDNWGNRSERYLTAVAYLDGIRPSVIAWRGYYAKTTATAYNLVNKKLVQVADFDTSTDGNGRYVGNGNHNLTVGDVDNDGCDEIICGSLCLDDDLSVLWCSGRGHGDALHLADYDPTHEGMEYFSVHEDYSGKKITGSTNGNDGKQLLGGMTLYAAADGEELFHEDGYGDTGRGMMANVGYGDGYFELWGAGNFISYGDTDVEKVKYSPDSTNFRIFWDGDLYDELLDGTGGGGSQIKISGGGKKGRVQSLRNVSTINDTKNNPCLQADLFGDWREEIVAKGSDSSLVIYTTTIPTEHKLYTLMHDRAYRMQVASQNSAYNQPPHISYYVSEDNDEYDARKTAAYVSTVYNGKTEMRNANLPSALFEFSIKVIGNQLRITNMEQRETDVVVYIAKYNDGILSNLTKQEITVAKNGYTGEIDADVGDTVYLWDKDMKPLAKKSIVQPIPTPKPTPKPTSTPTPKPTPTPTPEFEINNGKIIKYTGNDSIVTVPSVYNGEAVTSLSEIVFSRNKFIEEVILPDSIIEMEKSSFAFCSALKKITLPSELAEIPFYAFGECSSLTSINLENITSIGESAFMDCTALEEIVLGEVSSIGANAFIRCSNIQTVKVYGMNTDFSGSELMPQTIYGYTGSKAEEYANRKGISFVPLNEPTPAPTASPSPTSKPISDYVVEDGVLIEYTGSDTTVRIPETVNGEKITGIGTDAFSNNESIETVIIPDTITQIDEYAFAECTSLTYVKLPERLNVISNGLFSGCSNLSSVIMPYYDCKTIGSSAFYNCRNLKKVDILTDITFVDSEAFMGCEALESINIPDSVTQISIDAFSGCISLKSVHLPAKLEKIEESSFEGCSSLTEITIPETVTVIGRAAFAGCSSLTTVNMENAQEIGDFAFSDCPLIEEVTFGENTSYVGRSVLAGCSGLRKITVKNENVSLSQSRIEKLENVLIYGYLGSEAEYFSHMNDIPFYNLDTGEIVIKEWIIDNEGMLQKYNGSEKDIIIPSESGGIAITGISDEVFLESDITSIELPNSIEKVERWAFENCVLLKTAKLSAGMTSLSDIFAGCTALEQVVIPASITAIVNEPFADCENVTLYVAAGSYAEEYAKTNNIAYVIEATLPTPVHTATLTLIPAKTMLWEYGDMALNYGYRTKKKINM